jgi:hypothetical protein
VLKGKVHQKACVNVGAPNAIPSPLDDHLVSLNMVAGDKHPLAVLVVVGNEIVDQHPTI